ncbi:Ldh family oxidoreductase [Ralstonia syzygii]|uniref:Malate/L-sulfolactate dehydrogenase n=1 Tax=Ralstonia syzygii R24 TaxID=907261 RepID=G3AC37_9RALS|nr:Ldh family oxidoreductase [Ralstonia syzygii]CCA87111.1 malate/L-sulfolactate dehydrogenase [Ralstonia syzygii R24]
MSDTVNLTLEEVGALAKRVLTSNGFSPDHAAAIAKVIVAGQRDECQSHGLYRLLVCTHTIRTGKVKGVTEPEIIDQAPAIVRADAKFEYSLLSFERALPMLVEKARKTGLAALAINNCYHFSALWPEVEAIAAHGLVALAMTPSHSWVAPAGGTKPVFGTNPIAFAWPRPEGEPFVFDFATSAIARGDIELHRRQGKPIPLGWAIDADGEPTTDPIAALNGAMLTFGGHKGSALSAMIELLAGPLIGDLTSAESARLDGGAGATPCHGELLIAFDPSAFLGGAIAEHFKRAETMFCAITDQKARLPSQRRYEARQRSIAHGVSVPESLYADILRLMPSSNA